jgi:hypothetical protein
VKTLLGREAREARHPESEDFPRPVGQEDAAHAPPQDRRPWLSPFSDIRFNDY